MSSRPDLLDPVAVSQAEALGLHARYVVEGFLAGEHKSPFRGFSIEFTQHREYAPGDDLRHLDWKVLSRTDRYYLKQYEQETNFIAHLVVDGSESMRYGSRKLNGRLLTKLDYARQLAACMAYLVLSQRDAASLLLFDNAVKSYIPRTGSLASIHGMMSALAALDPVNPTAIGPVLHQVANTTPRRGIVILISDLLDDEQAVLSGIQHLRFIGHEVVVLHVMDPAELTFPFKGNTQFIGYEGIAPLLTRPAEIRKSYLAEVEAFKTRVRFGCEKNKSHYVLVDTSHPLHETLSAYLGFRLRTSTR